MGRYKKGFEFKGCNEDCFNCSYPDCMKPASDMKPTRDVTDIHRVDYGSGESQAKMYTLGGLGGAKQNLSKKFYK